MTRLLVVELLVEAYLTAHEEVAAGGVGGFAEADAEVEAEMKVVMAAEAVETEDEVELGVGAPLVPTVAAGDLVPS